MQSGLSLYIWSKTWMRDSHGLFDYESEHIAKSLFEVRCGGCLDRRGHSVQFQAQNSANGLPEPLLSVQPKADRSSVILSGLDLNLWTVVRFLPGPNKGLELTTDSVIKLGRVSFRVKEIGEGAETETPTGPEEEVLEVPEEVEEDMVCRICYERQTNKENPLLSPCRCDGTVKYLHMNCLKMWIKSKVTTRQTDNSVTYQWKTIECDICKLELPLTLQTKTGQVSLFQHDRPAAPYIVLEACNSAERGGSKALHVIMMSNGKQTIRLGRGHDSDVRINDISVSRCHAMIRFEAGRFLIEDNDSKFGTLVRASRQLELREDSSITVQVGRSLLGLQLKRSSPRVNEGTFRQIPIEEFTP